MGKDSFKLVTPAWAFRKILPFLKILKQGVNLIPLLAGKALVLIKQTDYGKQALLVKKPPVLPLFTGSFNTSRTYYKLTKTNEIFALTPEVAPSTKMNHLHDGQIVWEETKPAGKFSTRVTGNSKDIFDAGPFVGVGAAAIASPIWYRWYLHPNRYAVSAGHILGGVVGEVSGATAATPLRFYIPYSFNTASTGVYTTQLSMYAGVYAYVANMTAVGYTENDKAKFQIAKVDPAPRYTTTFTVSAPTGSATVSMFGGLEMLLDKITVEATPDGVGNTFAEALALIHDTETIAMDIATLGGFLYPTTITQVTVLKRYRTGAQQKRGIVLFDVTNVSNDPSHTSGHHDTPPPHNRTMGFIGTTQPDNWTYSVVDNSANSYVCHKYFSWVREKEIVDFFTGAKYTHEATYASIVGSVGDKALYSVQQGGGVLPLFCRGEIIASRPTAEAYSNGWWLFENITIDGVACGLLMFRNQVVIELHLFNSLTREVSLLFSIGNGDGYVADESVDPEATFVMLDNELLVFVHVTRAGISDVFIFSLTTFLLAGSANKQRITPANVSPYTTKWLATQGVVFDNAVPELVYQQQ